MGLNRRPPIILIVAPVAVATVLNTETGVDLGAVLLLRKSPTGSTANAVIAVTGVTVVGRILVAVRRLQTVRLNATWPVSLGRHLLVPWL